MLTLTKNYAVKTGQPREQSAILVMRYYAKVQNYENYLVGLIKLLCDTFAFPFLTDRHDEP